MRRKSTRNAQKASPEKPVKEAETPPKTRRSKRRKRSPTKSSDSEEEVIKVTKRAPFEETPDTTTKSHSPSDEETSQEPVWKVTSSEDVPKGEIQKLKICLTRPTPDSPDKTKTRRSKSNSQTEDDATSSEDKTTTTTTRRTRSRGSPLVKADGFSSQEAVDEDVEDKKGKGKSKGKHKSKIEKSTHLTDSEIQTNNEISENVQVTPQSPSIDKPVDNENDYNKVDADDKQIDNEKTDSRGTIGEESNNSAQISVASQSNSKIVIKDSDEEDDEPLSVIKKITKVEKKSIVQESKADSSSITKEKEKILIAETIADKLEETQEQDNQQEEIVCEEKASEPAAESVEKASVKLVKEIAVKDTESVKETVVEESESVQETAVENTESLKETAVENTESVKQTAVENTESVKETAVENTESIKETVVEKIETEKETISDKKAESIEDNKSVEEPIIETSESVKKSIVEENEPVKEEIVEENNSVKDTITEEVKPQEGSESIETDEPIQEKSNDDSRALLNAALNETGDIEMTDLSDDKYAPVKDPEPEEKPAEKAQIVVSSPEKREVVNEKTIRRRLKRDNELRNSESKEPDQKEDAFGLKPPKRVRWANKQTEPEEFLSKINLETIQSVYPQIDFPEEPDLNVEIQKERRKSTTSESSKKVERKVSVDYKSDNEKPTYETQNSVESTETTQENEDNTNIIAFNRKISIVDDTASKLKPPPSPAKNPSSEVLFMTNLVRPFTLKQLKELLERTGKICEDGFWTDRIKSKCYVKYESAEEAEATRNALHGVQWPIGNGKKLIIDFATVEDLEQAKNPPAPPPVVPVEIVPTKENLEPANEKSKIDEKAAKEANKRKIDGPVREWDIGKKDLQRDRSRSRERNRRHRKSPSPMDDFITRKQKKAEEAVPQKLMDDLFLKTKATPSIYWQPLSPDEISMKQQQRLVRMEEHKRRMAENTRGKGREMGRGAFRRRYD